MCSSGAMEPTMCTDMIPAPGAMELVPLELTIKICLPMCSSGAMEPTMCTDIPPAAGAMEPREGSFSVSTLAIAHADTVCFDPFNISQWSIKTMELVGFSSMLASHHLHHSRLVWITKAAIAGDASGATELKQPKHAGRACTDCDRQCSRSRSPTTCTN